jgi:hypothetical protein
MRLDQRITQFEFINYNVYRWFASVRNSGLGRTSMRQRDGKPLWISTSPDGAQPLERADLNIGTAVGGYDEKWLQSLLYHHPKVLPIEQIEPGFGQLIPLCQELPLSFGAGRTGDLDHLFITKDGRLVLVETKLWRNADARRKVVAQAMEYGAAVFRLNYEELDAAASLARKRAHEQPTHIFEIVRSHEKGIDEPAFVDAVSHNLRCGRAIIAVVGDGIREDIVPLAELLQRHAGHRFIFALIELAIYKTPEAGVDIIVPSILAQTALIERGVVRIEDGAVVVTEPAAIPSKTSPQRSFGISEDEFYEELGQRVPSAPALLKSFLAKAKALGIGADVQRALSLKHDFPGENDLNLGTIDKSGLLDTGTASWWGRTAIGRKYNTALASLIGGLVRDFNDGRESALRTSSGRMPRLLDLLPADEEAWLAAIDEYIQEAMRSVDENASKVVSDHADNSMSEISG